MVNLLILIMLCFFASSSTCVITLWSSDHGFFSNFRLKIVRVCTDSIYTSEVIQFERSFWVPPLPSTLSFQAVVWNVSLRQSNGGDQRSLAVRMDLTTSEVFFRWGLQVVLTGAKIRKIKKNHAKNWATFANANWIDDVFTTAAPEICLVLTWRVDAMQEQFDAPGSTPHPKTVALQLPVQTNLFQMIAVFLQIVMTSWFSARKRREVSKYQEILQSNRMNSMNLPLFQSKTSWAQLLSATNDTTRDDL